MEFHNKPNAHRDLEIFAIIIPIREYNDMLTEVGTAADSAIVPGFAKVRM